MEQRNQDRDKDRFQNKTVQRDSVHSGSSNVLNDEPCGDENTLLLVQKATHEARNDERSYTDQTLVDHTLHQGPRSSTSATEVNPTSDPDTIFEAMREGDKRWPEFRDVWENSTDRTTRAGDISKQGITRINEKDVSISQGLN